MTSTKVQKSHKSRYRSDSGKICIEVSLRSPKQLFDARDPAPFIDRDLDDNAFDYIVNSTEEFPIRAPLKLVLYDWIPMFEKRRHFRKFSEIEIEVVNPR